MNLMLLLTAQILCMPSPSNPFRAFARLFRMSCMTGSSRIAVDDDTMPMTIRKDQHIAIANSIVRELPPAIQTFSFSGSPKPEEFFSVAEWKLFKVLPAISGDGLGTETNGIDAHQRFEYLQDLFDPTGCDRTLDIANGDFFDPEEPSVIISNDLFAKECRLLFPAKLKVSQVHQINIWNLIDSNENGADFHLDDYGGSVGEFTSTIQLSGHRTFLFYTQQNLIAALLKYDKLPEITKNSKPKVPLHSSLKKLVGLRFEIIDELDNVSTWYHYLKQLNKKFDGNNIRLFPDHLMPMEVTIGPGEILVFDGSMVHATQNSKDKKPSIALFA